MVLPLAFLLALGTASFVNGIASYAPVRGACPSGQLLRAATSGVNPNETAYVSARYAQASKSLATWLQKIDPTFPVLKAGQYPTLAMSNGGGGLRGWTICAGIHKAFDGEEPTAYNYSTSGLYQAFTYEAGLSGSAIMLYSYVGNNWPLTSALLNDLWIPGFSAGINTPPGGAAAYGTIAAQQNKKNFAGYSTSLVDTWGRILSYFSFYGSNPGLSATISNITQLSGYTSFKRPYPIVTAIGVEIPANACGLPPQNASQYEWTPHEWGSWETGIGNFIQSKYVGTSMSNGRPLGLCTTGFDNIGWGAAVSSNTFNQQCGGTKSNINGFVGPALAVPFDYLLANLELGTIGLMPNPFANLPSAPRVSSEFQLRLVDGGETFQVPPLWPFLYRPDIDTVIISDNSADNPANNPGKYNFPSGGQIWNTYTQALANNISYRLPVIPPPATFQANNYNKNPMTFLGCSLAPNSPAMFFIYLPNRQVVFDSNIGATVLQYAPNVTAGMIANGEAIATNNGDPNFARCLACGIMKRSAAKANATLPTGCAACFTKYCAVGS